MSISGKKTVKVLVFGGGSLGGLYSYLFSTSTIANVESTIICRSNYEAVSTSGYTLKTSTWGNHTFRPHRVISSPSELINEKFNYIIVTTKAIPQPEGENPALAKFPIQKDVPIVLIQNGIGIEAPYRATFPENPIISTVAYVNASQPSPGHIHQVSGSTHIFLGLFDRPNPVDRGKVEYLSEIFNSSSFPAKVEDEIQFERWTKLGWNGSWNVICAITGLDTQAYLATSPEAIELLREVIREIARTANAAGVKLDEEIQVKRHIEITARPGALATVPSMLQDARNGQQMEIEVICGNVWRIAEENEIKTPRIKSLYTILAAMNWQFKNTQATPKI